MILASTMTGWSMTSIVNLRFGGQSLGSDMIGEMLTPAKLAIFVVMYPIFNLILVRVSPLYHFKAGHLMPGAQAAFIHVLIGV